MCRYTLTLSLACIFSISCIMTACSSSDQSTPVPEKEERTATGPAKVIAKVEFSSSGCFHHRDCRLLILQKGEQPYVRIENRGKTPVEKNLTPSQVASFKNFYTELKYLKEEDGCTTVDTYTVTFLNETIKKSDGSCSWHGFQSLCQSLFNSDYMSVFN